MKRHVYQLFTIENGIMLTTPVLDYIANNFKDLETIESLLRAFKSRYNDSSITLEHIKALSEAKSEECDAIFKTLQFKYVQKDFSKRFEALKSTLNIKITPISLLEEGTEQTIFGIFYKGRNESYCIEDDHDVIELNLDSVQNDVFVFENMFVCAKGVKSAVFSVVEFILVPFNIHKANNSFLKDKKLKICVFGSLGNDLKFAKNVLSEEKPELCIISTSNPAISKELSEFCTNIVVCPQKADCSYLPYKRDDTSNPFLLETRNSMIGFLDFDLFNFRKNGLFFNENQMEAFFKSIISQESICPFSGSDLSISHFPNIMIISQSYQPVVLDVEGVKFMSLPSSEDGYYGIVDFNNAVFEIRHI